MSFKALALLAQRTVPEVLIGRAGVAIGALTGTERTNGGSPRRDRKPRAAR
ncbi:MAG: hypothetical protein ABSB97_05080 [Thermoplasmata archaeon]